MNRSLFERAQEIKSRNQVLCSVPGSGFHDNDPYSPQSLGKPALRDHLVAFQDPWDVYLVGADAVTAVAALQDFHATHVSRITDTTDMVERKAIEFAGTVELVTVEGSPRLTVRAPQWNECLKALDLCGLGITITGMKGS
jgi:hypothetical protein